VAVGAAGGRGEQGQGGSGGVWGEGGEHKGYPWNPFGSGSALGFLPIPVHKVKGALALQARQRAEQNAAQVCVCVCVCTCVCVHVCVCVCWVWARVCACARACVCAGCRCKAGPSGYQHPPPSSPLLHIHPHYQGFEGAIHWAEAELAMSATQTNSSVCMVAGTCKPLGGYSVYAALPQLPFNQTSGCVLLPLPLLLLLLLMLLMLPVPPLIQLCPASSLLLHLQTVQLPFARCAHAHNHACM